MPVRISPVQFYFEMSRYMQECIEQNPGISDKRRGYDLLIYDPNDHHFPLEIAGVQVEKIDIDVAKFILMSELGSTVDHNRIFVEFYGKRNDERVHIMNRRMRDSGGRLVLTCGGEMLPRILPRCDLNIDDREDYSRGLELDEAQCTRFYQIFISLEPTVFPRPKIQP